MDIATCLATEAFSDMAHGYGQSDLGRRDNNEDCFEVRDDLGMYVVADGVGGQDGGEVASRIVVDTLIGFFERVEADAGFGHLDPHDRSVAERRMELAVRMCQREVIRLSQGRLSKMATTLAAVWVRDGHALIAHVGDSRVYRVRDGVLEVMTRDHSLSAELEAAGANYIAQRLTGALSAMITRSIARNANATPDIRVEEARKGDRFLLCSDGVHDIVAEEELEAILRDCSPDVGSRLIVDRARNLGGHDNITAIVVEV